MKNFDAAYQALNEQQKQAVNAIEGPVMVVAGPGTGKTQVMALRVANILKKQQMKPHNILCLTFSNTGVKAMRERLRQFIGSDAYGITVSTVHTFCNDIIQRNAELFAEFRTLEQVSQIERLRIIRQAFAEMPPGSILSKSYGDSDRASEVLSRINQMKRDGILVEDLQQLVPVYEEDIKTTPTGRERNPESAAYKDDLRRVDQFREFIGLYEHYNTALQETHRYDFDDMVLVVLRAFAEHDWLLAPLQENYQYILVDEFQDLNGAQNKVIEKLVDYVHTDQAPNVFVVGDDDQAIFRFQGANIGNMKSFINRFPKAEIITLTQNYRSTQQVLDAASAVIEHNTERLSNVLDGVTKHLTAAAQPAGDKPQFLRYPDTGTEYAAIADSLRQAHEAGTDWSDMAIICRTNDHVVEIADVLRAADIPSEIASKQDLITHPQVKEVITLLRAVLSPEPSDVLSAALALPCFGCHPADLGRLWVELRERQYATAKGEPPMYLQKLLLEKDADLPEAVQTAFLLILQLHQDRASLTLPEVLESLLLKSGLLPGKGSQAADPRVIAGLHAFYDYVKNRCYEQKSLTLEGLIADLDQYIAEPSLKLEYDMPHLVMDGVQLMTAHGAKGLEFDLVIIANAWYKNWGNRSSRNLSLPDHLIYEIDKEAEKQSSQEDERRLFYVAMTRARRQLHILFPETYRSGEQMTEAQVSSFIADAGDTLDEQKVPADQLLPPIETITPDTIDIDDAFRAFLEQRLEEFELSVTALNAFIRDPQEFLWEQLLQQPRAKAAHLSYGTAVHAALEQRNNSWKSGQGFADEDVLAAFEKYILERELFTEKDRQEYLHLGREVLGRYLQQTAGPAPIVIQAEKSFSAHLDDIPLKGKVDRIDVFEPNGKECRIIDFKTGNPKKTEAAVQKDEALFRQLVFYKLLCDLDQSFLYEATLFTFDFVGNDKEDRRVIDLQVSQQQADELKDLIRMVWHKITTLDFTPLEQ